MTVPKADTDEAVRLCRERLAEIDSALAELDRTRQMLVDEQDRLSLTVEAARDPSVLNRGGRQ